MACATQPTDGQEYPYTNPYPTPTPSYSKLLAPLNSQKPIKKENIDGFCYRAVQTAIGLYNHFSWNIYLENKDLYDEENKDRPEKHRPPYILGKNENVTGTACQHYADGKISVVVSTTYPQTVHVIFDENLNVLSWGFGDINQP